jgi:hypothetical protein|uniref:Uncharacterized protein n=1 Tax=candidate division WOR-3 bacterium TaxID=2052148 RepID=A0A7V3KMU4_UNCW3
MAEIKSIQAIQEKWARVTPGRTDDYTLGIKNPKRDWAQSATAAKESHKAAMTAAAANDSYAKGVAKAGTARWQEKASRKGPPRFAEGVAIGAPDYGTGFGPYADVIKATTLTPRFPRGDLRNLDRVKVISQALRKKKTG